MVSEETLSSLPPSVQTAIQIGGSGTTSQIYSSGGGSGTGGGVTIKDVLLETKGQPVTVEGKTQKQLTPKELAIYKIYQQRGIYPRTQSQTTPTVDETLRQDIQRSLYERQARNQVSKYEQLATRPYGKDISSFIKKSQQRMVDSFTGADIRTAQQYKPIQQTTPRYEEFQLDRRYVPKQPSGMISAKPDIEPSRTPLITKESDIYRKENVSGGFSFFSSIGSYGLAKSREETGIKKALGYAQFFTGVAGGIVYGVSPLGVGESIATRGLPQTVEDYTIGTATQLLNPQGMIQGTTPTERGISLLATAGGVYFAGKTADVIYKRPYKYAKSKRFESYVKKKFKNQLVVADDLRPIIRESGLSTDVRGRPLESISGYRKTVRGKGGTVQKGQIDLGLGELQSIDLNRPVTDFVMVKGTKVKVISGKSAGQPTNLPSKIVGQQNTVMIKKPMLKYVPQQNLMNYLGELKQMFTSLDDTVKITTSQSGTIRQTILSSKGGSQMVSLEVSKATISPVELSTGRALQTVKKGYTPKPASNMGLLPDKSTGVFLLEQVKVKPQPVVITTPSLIRVVDPKTGTFFEVKQTKGKSFDWLKDRKETPKPIRTQKETPISSTGGRQQQILLQKPKLKQQTSYLQSTKQKQVSKTKQKQKSKTIDDIMGRKAVAGRKIRSRVDEVLGIKSKQKGKLSLFQLSGQTSAQSKAILSAQSSASRQKAGQKAAQDQAIAQDQSIIQSSILDQSLATDQLVDTSVLTTESSITKTTTGGMPKPPKLPKPPIFPRKGIGRGKRTAGSPVRTSQGYSAYVKEKGKYVRLNKKPLPENKAYNLMADVLDNTPSATGYTVKKGKTKIRDDLNKRMLYKFRISRGKYIEKNRHRIDTQGELKGITVKGWLASKKKARRNKTLGLKKSRGNPKWV